MFLLIDLPVVGNHLCKKPFVGSCKLVVICGIDERLDFPVDMQDALEVVQLVLKHHRRKACEGIEAIARSEQGESNQFRRSRILEKTPRIRNELPAGKPGDGVRDSAAWTHRQFFPPQRRRQW